ncbi:MAG: sodium:solute symporter [Bacteroidetes bacterium 4572_128]|nr:MAG: sodium:solute symporter [Bacteroidetes bacterium 4572_128]
MSYLTIIFIILLYFLILLVISHFTSKKSDNKSFFIGNKKSPWFVVAFGMIGTSLSGVTFISVPAWVGSTQFTYMQMVFGYFLGYLVVANILMPLYYKLNLISIYSYLENRFGFYSYKTASFFFLLSRTIGASCRLFLVANVLQIIVFDQWNIPFFVTVLITIILIWLYTFRAGIKTIIWTDTLQTIFMLMALGIAIVLITKELNWSFTEMIREVSMSEHSKIFVWDDWKSKQHFLKQFLSGAFIAIVMTGLDQDMMQKNLSCKNIKEAKKNMLFFSIILIFVNLIFLSLGALLLIFSHEKGISLPENPDDLFPIIAMGNYLSPFLSLFFIIGLIAASYSSADSALTSLTTSFTVDILNSKNLSEKKLKNLRVKVHIFFSILLFFSILILKIVNNSNVIDVIFTIAGYTYGPLLGLYSFGLFTKFEIKDKFVPFLTVISPILTYLINIFFSNYLDYQFAYESLILNGLITFFFLFLIRKKNNFIKI